MNELAFPYGPLNSSDPSLALHYTSPRAANENAAIHLLTLCDSLPEYELPQILRKTSYMPNMEQEALRHLGNCFAICIV